MSVVLDLLVAGLAWGALYALIASALNLIYGVMKILNVAHGEFLMLAAYFSYWFFVWWGINPVLSAFIVFPIMFLLGMIVQRVLVDRIIKSSKSLEVLEQSSLVAFFGVLLVLQNIALTLWTGDYRTISWMDNAVSFLGISTALNRVVVAAISIVVMLLVYLYLSKSKTGLALRAVSQDNSTALLMGISISDINMVGFGLGIALAGVAGALAMSIYVVTPFIGLLFTIRAFTVMVVGGLGNQRGALIAGLGLGVAESAVSFLLGQNFRDVTTYVVLIVYLLWQAYFRMAEA